MFTYNRIFGTLLHFAPCRRRLKPQRNSSKSARSSRDNQRREYTSGQHGCDHLLWWRGTTTFDSQFCCYHAQRDACAAIYTKRGASSNSNLSLLDLELAPNLVIVSRWRLVRCSNPSFCSQFDWHSPPRVRSLFINKRKYLFLQPCLARQWSVTMEPG